VAEPIYQRIDRLRDLLVEHIDRTRQDPDLTRRSDVLALLVRARDERGEMLSDVDLRDDLVTLVAAGHETTAAAIGWACDLLAHHPEVVERLRQDDPGYLRATVKEVLRARTVAYAAAARVPLEPIRVEEWNVGADAMILVDAQGVHGDAGVYPEPEAFRPERFLGEQPDGYTYIPFGGGAHRCLGAQLALLEIEQFVQTLISDVGFTAAGPPARPHRRGPILAPGNQGRIRIS
jgi:cytochrome P450